MLLLSLAFSSTLYAGIDREATAEKLSNVCFSLKVGLVADRVLSVAGRSEYADIWFIDGHRYDSNFIPTLSDMAIGTQCSLSFRAYEQILHMYPGDQLKIVE